MKYGFENHHHSHSGSEEHDQNVEEWAEMLARSMAHIAAQLTMMQIRLRAMASALEDQGILNEEDIQQRAATIAETETARYVQENLGEALSELIDIETLANDISSFFRDDSE